MYICRLPLFVAFLKRGRLQHVRLTKWIRNKYRRFRRKHWYFAYKHLQGIAKNYPNLFEHWQYTGFCP